MRNLKIFTHSLLLITTPSLLLYSQESFPRTTIPVHRVNLKIDEENNLTNPNHFFSYDEIMDLLDELESGDLEERCSPEDLERMNHFLARLAKKGALPGDSDEFLDLENDIAVLLGQKDEFFQYAFSSGEDGECIFVPAVYNGESEVILCKSWVKKNWKKTKKFVKKHKKEIIIGAAIVVAATVVVVAVVAIPSAGAAAAATGAAGAAASSGSNEKEKSKPASKESSPSSSLPSIDTTPALETTNEAPILRAIIDEHISSFKEFAAEDVIIQSSDVHRDPSFGEKARNLGSILAHETLEGISEIASIIPQLGEELKDLSSRIIPQNMIPPDTNDLMGSPKENYENFIDKGHQIIDQAFSTDQAEQYSAEAKANDPMNDFAIGLLPPPGNFSNGLNISKFREAIEAGKETVVLAEELGFTAREIAQLEKAESLEKTVVTTFETLVNKPAMRTSFESFNRAEIFLKSYVGKYMPEVEARELIHQTGIRTFPRPKGIPENYRVKLSKNGAGIKYIHPENIHTSVRVMPGKPHSPHPSQQRPYVVQMKDGKAFDKFGNPVFHEAPEAHIPFEEFVYRGD
ncbi:MAG: hypothetical protein K1000chlam3_00770 [Chlamydiae bacterium]|nr:hypothetical protein [Chlamydiota bacterium]